MDVMPAPNRYVPAVHAENSRGQLVLWNMAEARHRVQTFRDRHLRPRSRKKNSRLFTIRFERFQWLKKFCQKEINKPRQNVFAPMNPPKVHTSYSGWLGDNADLLIDIVWVSQKHHHVGAT